MLNIELLWHHGQGVNSTSKLDIVLNKMSALYFTRSLNTEMGGDGPLSHAFCLGSQWGLGIR